MMGDRRRAYAAVAGVMLACFVPSLATAQPAADPRERYQRQGTDRPRTQQQFDESVRKFQSDDLPTRLQGVEEMGRIEEKDEPRALAYLLSAANDPDLSVRAKAIDTLGHMHATEATTPLVQRLFMRDTDDFTRRRIVAALGMIGDKRAVEPLLDFVSGNGDLQTRAGAIHALGEIGDERAIPDLEDIATDNPDPALRDVAKVAIRRIQSRPTPTEVPPALAGERFGAPPQGTN
jgi:HEAT repeat protein